MTDHNHEHTPSIKDSVLARIHTERTVMRPKFYFILKIVALVAVAFAALAVSILIFNFILFSIRVNAQTELFAFGPRGILFFFLLFPWPLLLIDIALIGLLEWLLRKFQFGYRRPVLYMILVLLVLTVSAGIAIDRATDVNDRLLRHAEERGLPPPLQGVFDHARQGPLRESGVCKCRITGIDGTTIQALDVNPRSVERYTITLDETDPILGTLQVGDIMLIAGDEDGDSVRPFGVRKLSR